MHPLAQLIGSFNPAQEFTPPASWYQGRTVYGGLLAALALQTALLDSQQDSASLQSAHVSFIAPATKKLLFEPELLRQGRSVSSLSVDCLSDGELAARVALVFTRSRTSEIEHNFLPCPLIKGPMSYHTLNAVDKYAAPDYSHNFEMRPAGSTLPFTGSINPELLFWMRHQDAREVDPTVALIALADGLPPAVTTSLIETAKYRSIAWTLDLMQPPPVGHWFLMRSFSRQAHNGYSVQDMEIWDESGRLALCGRQTIAILA
ncbi:thioesterase family protein [Burkholderia cepacia]|uniref:thioesterase family protein n=1 Tax=Burkholderia cepacia TaxID=292 RepID=UPI0009C196E5|nr:thioesterase family protein [Burkholderia cepacia]